jgi:hypothetical protein
MLSAGGFCDLKAKAPHGVPFRPSAEVRRGGGILAFLHEAHMLCCFFVSCHTFAVGLVLLLSVSLVCMSRNV